MHVRAGLQREPCLGVVQTDRRCDGNGVHVALGEQRLDVRERLRDAEALGHGIGAPWHRVAHGRHLHAVLHVVLREVRQQPAQRDRAGADDAQAQGSVSCHVRPSSSETSTKRPTPAARRAPAITASTWIARSAESEGSAPLATHSTSCSTPSR